MIRFFCRHKWEEISKEILPSAWEQFISNGEVAIPEGIMIDSGGVPIEPLGIPPWVFSKRLVIVIGCSECGKLFVVNKECPEMTSGDRTIYRGFYMRYGVK